MPRLRHVLRYCRAFRLIRGRLPTRAEAARYFGRPPRTRPLLRVVRPCN